jgi:hypothetical protein
MTLRNVVFALGIAAESQRGCLYEIRITASEYTKGATGDTKYEKQPDPLR